MRPPNIRHAQTMAESLMVDSCAVTRTTSGTWDDSTGTSGSSTTAVYSGRCRVQTRDVQPNEVPAGAAAWTLLSFVVSVPIAVVGVEVGDVVTVTGSVSDPDLAGRQFKVIGLVHKTFLSARRLVCQEVQ